MAATVCRWWGRFCIPLGTSTPPLPTSTMTEVEIPSATERSSSLTRSRPALSPPSTSGRRGGILVSRTMTPGTLHGLLAWTSASLLGWMAVTGKFRCRCGARLGIKETIVQLADRLFGPSGRNVNRGRANGDSDHHYLRPYWE